MRRRQDISLRQHALTAKGGALSIRDAEAADLPDILKIFNDVVATSTAIFSDKPSTLDERMAWFQGRQAQNYPVLAACAGDELVGFASFGDFRSWPGYRFTVEHSVHVRADWRGSGIGQALMTALLPRGAALGKHIMVAGIDAANEGSIRFHQRLGFTQAGQLNEVGYKFDRWLDLVFMQCKLDHYAGPHAVVD